MTPYNDATVPM